MQSSTHTLIRITRSYSSKRRKRVKEGKRIRHKLLAIRDEIHERAGLEHACLPDLDMEPLLNFLVYSNSLLGPRSGLPGPLDVLDDAVRHLDNWIEKNRIELAAIRQPMSKDQLLEGTPRRQPFFYFEALPARAQGPFFAQLLKNIYLHVKACHRNNERMRPDKEIEPEVFSAPMAWRQSPGLLHREVRASFSGEQDPKDTAMRQRPGTALRMTTSKGY